MVHVESERRFFSKIFNISSTDTCTHTFLPLSCSRQEAILRSCLNVQLHLHHKHCRLNLKKCTSASKAGRYATQRTTGDFGPIYQVILCSFHAAAVPLETTRGQQQSKLHIEQNRKTEKKRNGTTEKTRRTTYSATALVALFPKWPGMVLQIFFFSKYWNRKLNSCKTVDSECKTAALFSYKISKVKTVW